MAKWVGVGAAAGAATVGLHRYLYPNIVRGMAELDKQTTDSYIRTKLRDNVKTAGVPVAVLDDAAIYLAKDIEESDKVEDAIIEIVQKNVKPEESFFIQALETGSLPQEWIEKVLLLINPPQPPSPSEKDVEVEKTALTKAASEKPLNTRRRLATTRRANMKVTTSNKKNLAKTRRNVK